VKATSLLQPGLKLIYLELNAQTTFPHKHSWSAQGQLCIYPTCWFVSPKSNQGDDFRPWRRQAHRKVNQCSADGGHNNTIHWLGFIALSSVSADDENKVFEGSKDLRLGEVSYWVVLWLVTLCSLVGRY
jgi:hypothetical protein